MNRAPNYYQLLNVSSSASADEIRNAYLRVMKRHHPDVSGDRSHPSDFLSLVNQIYKSLSDPTLRAAYDAQLASEARSRRSGRAIATVAHARRSGDATAAPARAWHAIEKRSAVLLVVTLALWIGALLLSPGQDGPPALEGAYARVLAWPRSNLSASQHLAPPSLPAAADIRRFAHLGANLSPEEHEARSRVCFAQALQATARSAAQLCVILDDAFLYTHGAPSLASPYFDKMVVRLRHTAALDVASDDPLLERLWQASFKALLTELRGASPAASKPIEGRSSDPNDASRTAGDFPAAGLTQSGTAAAR